MRNNFSLILSVFKLSEVKAFSNLKLCDILNLDQFSKLEISDSNSLVHPTVCYLDISQASDLLTLTKAQKITWSERL